MNNVSFNKILSFLALIFVLTLCYYFIPKVSLSTVLKSSTGLVNAAPTNGLVAYWKLDEESGTVATDSSGNGKTGTLFNGPTFTSGKFGGALNFDGVSDYVKASLTQTGPFSVSLWVKTNKTSQAEWTGIFSSADSPAASTFQIDIGGTSKVGCNGQYRFYGEDKSGQNISLCFGPYTADWQFLTVTFDGTAIRTYVNGVLKASGSPSFAGSIQLLKLGANRGTNLFFAGVVDEVRVYNRALSSTEIEDYNRALSAREFTPLSQKPGALSIPQTSGFQQTASQ
jgi:concanavalin A-like lectin/glucanase superfamily protein